MADTGDEMLNMMGEKVMSQPVKPDQVAYCPTMDLIALTTVDEQVHVYRLNGQRVFGFANRKAGRNISQIRWKADGQLLAVALTGHDEASVLYISAETGKITRRMLSTGTRSNICCLGWGSNSLRAPAAPNLQAGSESLNNLKDILKSKSPSQQPVPIDLPYELAFLDVDGLLPKLSVLSVGGKEDEMFSSRQSLDALFHSSAQDSRDSADVLLLGYDNGTCHLSIFNTFSIGPFDSSYIAGTTERGRIILHASHSESSTHALLAQISVKAGHGLYLIPLDLRLMTDTGRYSSLLATKSSQLTLLTRYIEGVQIHIESEFTASQDLQARFIQNIEEALQEKCHCSWMHAAYHLVVTGHCYAPVKEWLVEELAERNHKRWEKAVSTGYRNIQGLVFEHLLPALERLSVLVSRLRGLSRFQESANSLGLESSELESILDTVSCLTLLAHKILITVGSELLQFNAFSAWMRQEIEIQGMDPNSTTTDESAEKDNAIDHEKVLEYIQGAMLESGLFELLNLQPKIDTRSQWEDIVELTPKRRLIYDMYKREMKTFSHGNLPEKRLPGLAILIARLRTLCNLVLIRSQEALKRKVRFGSKISLGSYGGYLDMRVMVEPSSSTSDECTTYVAIAQPNAESVFQHVLTIHKIVLTMHKGVSSPASHEVALINLPSDTVKDIKFIDDTTVMLAISNDSSSRLLSLPYRGPDTIAFYEPYNPQHGTKLQPNNFSTVAGLRPFILHTFPKGPSWTVEKIEINGREGRRVVCCLAQDRTRYRVFDLDSKEIEEEEEDEGDETMEEREEEENEMMVDINE